jgi:NAD(P)-dependent dehydrogenase (short-subunit alcohol dehydrogenase family)
MDSFNPFSLSGKTIVVTGASSGIGRQCAIDCSKMGARLILVARNEERLQETLCMLSGSEHFYYSFDLCLIESIKDFISKIVCEHGKIDGFVHAAGIEKTLPVKLLSYHDYEKIYRVNAISAFEFIHHFSNKEYFNNGGHIVLIASISSIVGRKGLAAYAASKGAITSAIRPMALEFAKRNICVNSISPGTILTPLMQDVLHSLSE